MSSREGSKAKGAAGDNTCTPQVWAQEGLELAIQQQMDEDAFECPCSIPGHPQ